MRDVRRGLPCDGRCMGGAHICADDAREFLASEQARNWFDLLDIGADVVKEWATSQLTGE